MQKLNDLHLVNLIGFLLVGIILVFPDSPLRIALGLPFVLFFPGYALTAALYPRRGDLEPIERAVLSVGLSLAIVPLIGLMLNFLPWGIHIEPILISLMASTSICSLLATWFRRRLAQPERFSGEIPPLTTQVRSLSRSQIAVVITAIASLGFIGWRLNVGTPPTAEAFTEFYVLGPSGKAEGYPRLIIAGRSAEVVLGIINHERARVTYKIIARTGDRVLAAIGPITVGDGGKWQRTMKFNTIRSGNHENIDFLLLKNDNPTPYRRLHIWVQVAPPQ